MIAGLPYDAEVEYLESTGTQWIDTGIYGSQSIGAEVKVMWREIAPDNPAYNADNGSISNGSFSVFMSRTLLRYGRNSPGIFKNGIFSLSANVFYDIVNKSDVVSVDGDAITPNPSGEFVTDGTIPLFAWKRNANIIIKGKTVIAFMKMWDNGVLVRDFIPVRFTNELGQSEGAMYDRVSRKLFRNAGTGAFTIGPDVATPVMGLHFMPRPKYTARDYVQNGLIAMWDGIENAGWGVHDSNATVWKDLSGNGHDGVFSTAPTWYANALLSKTTDGACNVGKVLSGLTDVTIEVVVSGWATAKYRWAFNDVNRGDSYGIQRYDVATTVLFKAAGTRWYRHNLTAVANTIALGVYASSDGSATGYANASQVTSFSFASANIETNTEKVYAIGQGDDYGVYHHVRIYGRILSPAEIAANYAIDKERFGLP